MDHRKIKSRRAERFVASLVLGHITADKRLWCSAPSPKLPSATSFIPKPLYEIPHATFKKVKYIILWNQQNEKR